MGASTRTLLETLHSLGEVDASLARVRAEVITLRNELQEKRAELESKRAAKTDIETNLSTKREKFRQEERRLKEESQKLVDRRKALSSFNNYKVQQSAQKEIEQTAKQISQQEEKLLSTMDGVEEQEAQLKELTEELGSLEEGFQKFEAEAEEALARFSEQESEKLSKREELVTAVPPQELKRYQRISNRHPMDPVVTLVNGTCQGCFMQLGPQTVVQVSRMEGIITCRGCSRILRLPPEEGSEDSAQAG